MSEYKEIDAEWKYLTRQSLAQNQLKWVDGFETGGGILFGFGVLALLPTGAGGSGAVVGAAFGGAALAWSLFGMRRKKGYMPVYQIKVDGVDMGCRPWDSDLGDPLEHYTEKFGGREVSVDHVSDMPTYL